MIKIVISIRLTLYSLKKIHDIISLSIKKVLYIMSKKFTEEKKQYCISLPVW